MGLEIERKFLIDHHKLQLESFKEFLYIQQGYLSQEPERVVRIRKKNDAAFLTIKGKNVGATRLEMEYQIPFDDATSLLQICLPHLIEKKRYLFIIGKHTWEVDCFLGDNQGLWIAEIELSSEDEPFEMPDWITQEVTSDHRYSNSYLSQHPFSSWEQP
jgi:adenylate cyclase